jgi:hypothetical protein
MKAPGAVVIVLVALIGGNVAFPTYTHRFKLTVEVDTPDGRKSASSVIEVARKDVRWIFFAQGQYEFRLRGEAVFVDLGGKRNVVALLAHGPRADGIDQMLSLLIEAYGYDRWDENAWSGRARMEGPVELRPPLIPTLISVTDLSDPKSAQVLTGASDQAAELLGPNVRIARVWLERVATSRWPLGVLFQRGAALTERISKRSRSCPPIATFCFGSETTCRRAFSRNITISRGTDDGDI